MFHRGHSCQQQSGRICFQNQILESLNIYLALTFCAVNILFLRQRLLSPCSSDTRGRKKNAFQFYLNTDLSPNIRNDLYLVFSIIHSYCKAPVCSVVTVSKIKPFRLAYIRLY